MGKHTFLGSQPVSIREGERTEEESLSRREREILESLCQGYSNQDIASRLSLSVETVRWHLKKIYEKLHVSSRTEAMAKFMAQPRR